MTKAEMRADVYRRLREAAAAPVFWTDAEVDLAIDEGYAELSDATEWCEQYLELDLLRDRPYYDLRTVIGDPFLAIRPAFDETTNRWLIPTHARELDARDRRWERVTGQPQRLLMHGLWWLGFYPRRDAELGVIKQYYVALPEPLTDDDEPGFPDVFHTGCVEWACADLWAQDAETGFALAAWAQYLETEAALLAWVESRGAGPMVRGFVGSA